jgi:FtsH-binding integral membrane protein
MDEVIHDEIVDPRTNAEHTDFITKVYAWMTFALFLSGMASVWVAFTPAITSLIFGNRFIFYGLLIFELAMVLYLSFLVKKISAFNATVAFIIYSIVRGLTLSVIFLVYTIASIIATFFITAGVFGAMSAYGYFTKRDLTTMGNLLIMALLGLIIASVVNLFYFNSLLDWVITYAGVVIFVGLTAYDTQKIKNGNIIGNAGTDEDKKEAIMGALTLYLDFINLFLKLLRIFGKKK